MKLFRFVFFAVLLFASAHVFAQNDNGLGFFTKEQIDERDAINEAWSKYLVNDWTEPQVNYDYMNRVIQQSGGITISNDNSTVRTGSSQNKSAARQRQQMQKAQDEARHRAWLEQRQAERERAAEQQRILDELRIQRELEEAQRRYDKAYQEELNRNAGHYARLHDNVTYNATVGYDNMINHHAPGTERIQSVYLPSKQTEVNIDHIVSRRRSGRPAIIGLTGNEVPTTGDSSNYDKAIEKIWLEDEARRKELPKVEIKNPYELTQEDTTDIVDYEIVPISNGCGTADDKTSQELAHLASVIEASTSFSYEINGVRFYTILPHIPSKEEIKALEKYCDIHDIAYFYGETKEDKLKADLELYKKSPIKGMAVMLSPQSMRAFQNARKEREMSEHLQKKFNVTVPYGYMLVPRCPLRKTNK